MTRPGKGGVRVGGDSKARHNRNELNRDEGDDNEVGDGEVEDDKVGMKGQKISKSKNLSKSKKTELDFFTSRAKMTFTKLSQVFVKASILYHFDPERHI